jgi:hypothetical protein
MLTKENKREPNDLGLDRIAYAAVRHGGLALSDAGTRRFVFLPARVVPPNLA